MFGLIAWVKSLRISGDQIEQQANNATIAIPPDTPGRPSWSKVLSGCCDCGCFHEFDYSVDPSGVLHIRGRRNEPVTAMMRRERAFRFTAR